MSKFFKGDVTNGVVEFNLLDPAVGAGGTTATVVTRNTGPNDVTKVVGDISSNAFYLTSVEGLVIGTSCTSIGSMAFYASNISGDLVIPDSVTSVGDSAFGGAAHPRITSLTLGESLLTIGANCFEFLQGLSGDLIIPDSVTSIGNGSFTGCSFDGTLTIGNSVTSIGSSAFGGTNFTDVNIRDSVTSIGSYAFNYCSSLTAFYTNTPAASWVGTNALLSTAALVNIYEGPDVTGQYSATFQGGSGMTVSAWTNYPNIP